MGMNFILPIIAGIIMMATLGASIGPSFVEQMKIKKVENRTIANQNLIKDAIVRYIKIKGEVPDAKKGLADLEAAELIQEHHKKNFFHNDEYSFYIDKKLGTLKIFTTINDDVAGKYFSNSFKFPNAPTCIKDQNGACTGKFETFYLLDEDTFKSIPIPKVGSIEDIQDRFTKVEEVGKKFDEATLVGGEKDYIVDLVTKEVTEYTFDKDKNKWVENPTKIVVPSLNPSDHGVEIKNITWDFIDGLGNKVKQTHEKVVCKYEKKNSSLIDLNYYAKDFFVINQITGLGEIVWVAPNSVTDIQNKIFGLGHNNTSPVVYTPNNICTSNVTSMYEMFNYKTTFNKPLSRWDTFNVTSMYGMFYFAEKFNQPLNFDTFNVTSMQRMFFNATSFNQSLNFNTSNVTSIMKEMFYNASSFNNGCLENDFSCPLKFNTSNVITMQDMFYKASSFNQPVNFDTSKVTNMSYMFQNATNFSQPLNFNTSEVVDMRWMFRSATSFNQPLNFNTSNVTNMERMFEYASSFNQDLSSWCVSQIAKPTNFDSGSGFAGLTSKQPKWKQTCP